MEERALETEKDYQRELKSLDKAITETNNEIADLILEIERSEKKLKNLKGLQEEQAKMYNKLAKEAKEKGFKFRNEATDFEARKNEVLARLEQ